MDDKLTTSDFYRKFDIAREKGEKFVNPDLRQKVGQRVVADIKQLDVSLLDLEQFTEKVVNLIRDRFGLYFVALYLLNDARNWVAYEAGSGTIGELLKERTDRLPLEASDVSFVTAIKLNETQLIDDVIALWSTKRYMANPFRPDTRAEIALPLQTQQDTVGSLLICSCIPDSLSSSDIAVFRLVADQVASVCTNLIRTEDGD